MLKQTAVLLVSLKARGARHDGLEGAVFCWHEAAAHRHNREKCDLLQVCALAGHATQTMMSC